MSDQKGREGSEGLSIQMVPLADLVHYENNPRKNDQAVELIANSIKEYGWTQPIVVDAQNVIVAGHTRAKAAALLGMTEVPVYRASQWSEKQANAYRIADNKLAEKAEWDMDALKVEIEGLDALDVSLPDLGFGTDEIASMLGKNEGLTDPDELPEAPTPRTKEGDIWILGRHRLVCGDSENEETVRRCLNGAKPNLMVTDPPYGVNYDPNWRNEADRPSGKPYGASAVGVVSNDHKCDWRAAYKLFLGDVAYIWTPAGSNQFMFWESITVSGFEVRMQIIWAKNMFPIGRGHYHVQHEPCYYAVREGKSANWQGSRKETTLWEIPRPRKSETGHSTQKPVECMARPIRNNSKAGDAVYDPFCGSGTAIIACEMEGRNCYAVELDPNYCDVIVDRWEKFTGETAIHEPC